MALLSSCTSLPESYPRNVTRAYTETEATGIGQHIEEATGLDPDLSAFLPLADGLDAMVARLALIDAAQKSIDVQYYLFHGDMTGSLFLQRLVMAADRGVRVRLLVDDLSAASNDKTIAVANSHPNIKIRLFNPVVSRGFLRPLRMVTDFSRINRRMHNKSFIVDNQIAIIGGRNIGDEYYRASAVEFADLDMLQIGASVPELSDVFDDYWNFEMSFPAEVIVSPGKVKDDDLLRLRGKLQKNLESAEAQRYLQRLRSAPVVQELKSGGVPWFWGPATVYADRPDKILLNPKATEDHLMSQLLPWFDQARKELVILTPYFVPGKEGMKFLQTLLDRGVSVTVFTNSLASTDVSIVHAGYSRYRKELLRSGIKLVEMKPHMKERKKSLSGSSQASLHAKTYIVDRRMLFVGSLNLDPRSIVLNTEVGVVYHSQELVQSLMSSARESSDHYYWVLGLGDRGIEWRDDEGEIQSRVDPETSWLLRLGISLMSFLPIESQL
ncbi:MAG: phospholipase D-like domain-containing protein [Endozoicomonas sp.]